MRRTNCIVLLSGLIFVTIAACQESPETTAPAIDKPDLTLIVHSWRHGNTEVPDEWPDHGKGTAGEVRIEIRKVDKPQPGRLYHWFYLGEQHEIDSAEIETAVLHFIQSCDSDRDAVVHVFREQNMEREVLSAAFKIAGIARNTNREFDLRRYERIADVFY